MRIVRVSLPRNTVIHILCMTLWHWYVTVLYICSNSTHHQNYGSNRIRFFLFAKICKYISKSCDFRHKTQQKCIYKTCDYLDTGVMTLEHKQKDTPTLIYSLSLTLHHDGVCVECIDEENCVVGLAAPSHRRHGGPGSHGEIIHVDACRGAARVDSRPAW